MSTLSARRIFDFFLFSNLFMAICATGLVYQTYLLLDKKLNADFTGFVFFSTLCNYNFHWMLTPADAAGTRHVAWSRKNRLLHIILFLAGLTGAGWFFFSLMDAWIYLTLSAVLTFIYTAPKIPVVPFRWLKKIAIGKTIFLAMMWVFVTLILPLIIEQMEFTRDYRLITAAQFFFIFCISILFDYRDREHDRAEQIISLITRLSEKDIDRLYYFSAIMYPALYVCLGFAGFPLTTLICLMLPAPVLLTIYRYAKKSDSDYLYYFLLDGLLILPCIFLWLVNRI